MTDKQIIIDGVDVKQCKYFNSYQKIVRNNECIVDMQNACIEEIKTKPCSQKLNCYFKNWQHKEQECEQLKAELELFKTSNQTTIDQLKKENEELKKDTERWKSNFNGKVSAIEELLQQLDQLKAENEDLKKSVLQECPNCGEEYLNYKGAALYFENSDLKQTLAEIKEICNKTVCDYLQCSLNYNHSKDFECEKTSCNRAKRRKFILEILQKINEVEDGKSNN